MTGQMTVERLYQECARLMRMGLGKKIVLVTDDDEGNGYHALWYDFTTDVNQIRETKQVCYFHDDDDPKDVVLIG